MTCAEATVVQVRGLKKPRHLLPYRGFRPLLVALSASLGRRSRVIFSRDARPDCNSRWGEPVLDFAKALKAHAELRCTAPDKEKGYGEMYARMTYWVCACASSRLCIARGRATWSCVGELYSVAAREVVL